MRSTFAALAVTLLGGCVALGDGAVAMRVAFAPSGFRVQVVPPETARIDVTVNAANGEVRTASLTPQQPSLLIKAPAGSAQVVAEAKSAAGILLAKGQSSAQVIAGGRVAVTVTMEVTDNPVVNPSPTPAPSSGPDPAGEPAPASSQAPNEQPASPQPAPSASSSTSPSSGGGGGGGPAQAPVGAGGTITAGAPYSGPLIWGP